MHALLACGMPPVAARARAHHLLPPHPLLLQATAPGGKLLQQVAVNMDTCEEETSLREDNVGPVAGPAGTTSG